jgi:histidine triad (HIT) family protein
VIDRTVAECLFCKIVRREIPVKEITRTSDAIAFYDSTPKAPTHVLVIPTRHAENLGDFVAVAEPAEVGDLFAIASAAGRAASANGYRIVVNEGADGGQTVFHLHLHVLAGRPMTWPPG